MMSIFSIILVTSLLSAYFAINFFLWTTGVFLGEHPCSKSSIKVALFGIFMMLFGIDP